MSRSRTQKKPFRFAIITTLRVRPPIGRSASTGTSLASQSCVSCGVNWKCQRNAPVSGFSATSESSYRLAPGRLSPSQSGLGLPVPQHGGLASGS